MVEFYHVYGLKNPYDIISKHWRYIKILVFLELLLRLVGDDIDLLHLELNIYDGPEKGV